MSTISSGPTPPTATESAAPDPIEPVVSAELAESGTSMVERTRPKRLETPAALSVSNGAIGGGGSAVGAAVGVASARSMVACNAGSVAPVSTVDTSPVSSHVAPGRTARAAARLGSTPSFLTESRVTSLKSSAPLSSHSSTFCGVGSAAGGIEVRRTAGSFHSSSHASSLHVSENDSFGANMSAVRFGTRGLGAEF